MTKNKLFKDLKYLILDSEIYDLIRHFIIFFNKIKKVFLNKKNSSEILKYWQNPNDGNNNPLQYLGKGYFQNPRAIERSKNLIEIIESFGIQNPSILEIGCNVGRNLNALNLAGFKNLSAIEINQNAIDLMNEHFPETHKITNISVGPAQEILKKFENKKFDIVYSMAVLQHIPNEDIKNVTQEISRVCGNYLVSYETETYSSWRHFPRSYKTLYKKLNFKYLYRKLGARVFRITK
jgi:2-polyprenyl-3-methyl-5-hydroxy-6-metoxy-1,4-benzoquinol methylase